MDADRHRWLYTSDVWPAPLTVGILSDTHLSQAQEQHGLSRTVVDELAQAQVGLILHAGDIFSAWVLDYLSEIAPVLAVHGNWDSRLQEMLPASRTITIGEHRIGLVHGHEGRGTNTPRRALSNFTSDGNISCVIFGHSHKPYRQAHEWRSAQQQVLLFNPGATTSHVGLIHVSEAIQLELHPAVRDAALERGYSI